MRKLVTLVLLAVALVAADVLARAWAESELAAQAAAYYPPSSASSAQIHSFPFLGRLLVGGDVSAVSLRLENLAAGVLALRRLQFDLDDVKVDRRELFSGRVRVLDIGAGRIEALVDGSSLARAVGLDVRFADGEVEVHRDIRGVDVSATARVTLEGNKLRIVPTSVQGLKVPVSNFAVSYDIPGVQLLPCTAGVRPVPAGLLVSCSVDDVPPALVQGSAAAALRGRS
jgi:hypothetical protein